MWLYEFTYPLVAQLFLNKTCFNIVVDYQLSFSIRKNCKYKLLSLSSYFIPRISSRYSIIFMVNTNIKYIYICILDIFKFTYLLTYLFKLNLRMKIIILTMLTMLTMLKSMTHVGNGVMGSFHMEGALGPRS